MLTPGWFPKHLQNFSDLEILQEQQSVLIPAVCFMCVIFIVGTIGNLLVAVIYGFRMTRHSSHYFILMLACIDLFSCLFAVPLDIIDMLFPILLYNIAFCKTYKTIVYASILSSTYTLIAIASDRHRKICNPLVTQMSRLRWWYVVSLVVVLGVMTTWPVVILFGDTNIPTGVRNLSYGICNIASSYEETIWPTLFHGLYYIIFSVSIVVLFVLYFRIWRQIKNHIRFMQQHANVYSAESNVDIRKENGGTPKSESTRTSKVTRTTFVVTLCFLISFVPHFISVALVFKVPNF